ncbi:coiled-coil domain-containing protein 158 isoform X2 [Engystomops pustulosus]|uniref:coiled-coil domain-containing protein 158 isoform X2 n=1 Tax=Engystomops pustulosus TaxID=76066 RepID=UPI003AFB5EC2
MASKNILALRAELDEQTKEIQKLQKEVEKATQNTINQLSVSYREQCYKTGLINTHNEAREPCTSSSVEGYPRACSSVANQALQLKSSSVTGQTMDPKETNLLRNCALMQNILPESRYLVDIHNERTALKECSTLFKDSQRGFEQINHFQGIEQPHISQPTSRIHLQIQELVRERSAEMDKSLWRPKGSISKEEVIKVDSKVQELEKTNVIQEEMLKQTQVYTELLKEKLHKQNKILQDTQKAILVYNELSNRRVEDNVDLSNLGVIVDQIFQELLHEVSLLKGKIQLGENHLDSLKGDLKDKDTCLKQLQESYDNLVNEREQERALLVSEMNAVRSHAQNIQTQLESSQDQNAEHEKHIANLESEVSRLQCDLRNDKKTYRDKVEELKKEILSTNGALKNLQNEHSQYKEEYGCQILQLNEALETYEKQLALEKEQTKQLQEQERVHCLANESLQRELIERRIEVERLQTLMNMVKEESQKKTEQQLRIIQEKTASLDCTSFQLESMKDALQKISDELTAKSQCLDHAEKCLTETRNLLAEKDRSLQCVFDELKKLRLYAESKKREVQQIRADNEKMTELQRDTDTLKLLLVEKDNMIVTLRGQIEAITHMIDQQNQKVDVLEMEKSQLLDEVAAKKCQLQDLALKAETKEKRIAELEEICTTSELEKSKLMHSNTRKILSAKKMKKEREEIMAELRETKSDLANLAEDYKILKRKYENQTGDTENTTTILKMQLKAAIAELEHAKTTLNTVEDCDGQAVKIATRMQKKITAKREQIDMLQSRVHLLEEALSNATKDKHVLKVERKKLMQECVHEASERYKLSETLETLKAENNTLKVNVTRTEAALEKTLLQLSECQKVMQHLEQETMRLQLQHTLELQEFKGPVSDLLGRSVHSDSTDLFHLQKKKLMCISDALKISKEIVEKPLEDVKHLPNSLSPFKKEAMKMRKNSNITLDHISKEQLTLHTAHLADKDSTVKLSYASSPKKQINEQEVKPKSPVHCLLTTAACDMDSNGKFYSPTNDHELVLDISAIFRTADENHFM